MQAFSILNESRERVAVKIAEKDFELLETVRKEVIEELKLKNKELSSLRNMQTVLKEIKKDIKDLLYDLVLIKKLEVYEKELVKSVPPEKGWSAAPQEDKEQALSIAYKLTFTKEEGIKKIEEIGKKLMLLKQLLNYVSEEERQGKAVKGKLNGFVNAASESLIFYAKHLRTPFFRHHEELNRALTFIPRRRVRARIPIKLPI